MHLLCFFYRTELGSTIHPDHVDIFHKNSYNAILNFWKNNGYNMTIDKITDYNPYLGKVTEHQELSNDGSIKSN